MGGRYAQRIRDTDIDFVKTNRRLKSAGLKAEIKGLIVVAQVKSLRTRKYEANIIKNASCRFCEQKTESIERLESRWPILIQTGYKE